MNTEQLINELRALYRSQEMRLHTLNPICCSEEIPYREERKTCLMICSRLSDLLDILENDSLPQDTRLDQFRKAADAALNKWKAWAAGNPEVRKASVKLTELVILSRIP